MRNDSDYEYRRFAYAAVCSVLEADGEGDAAGELTVQLRLGGAGTDRAPGDEIRDVLWGDGVEQLGADGDAQVGQVAKQLAGDADTLVDLEGAVNIGVVNETLPADGGTRFLSVILRQYTSPLYHCGNRRLTSLYKRTATVSASSKAENIELYSQVSTHDDVQVGPRGHLLPEKVGVLDALLRRVDGAGADDDDHPVVLACKNAGRGVAGSGSGGLRLRRSADLVAEEGGLDQGVVLRLVSQLLTNSSGEAGAKSGSSEDHFWMREEGEKFKKV